MQGYGCYYVEQVSSHIWTFCVVHTLNFALKNICATKNMKANVVTYAQWQLDHRCLDALIIKKFIMNHSMRLAMFNDFSKMKLLAVAET